MKGPTPVGRNQHVCKEMVKLLRLRSKATTRVILGASSSARVATPQNFCQMHRACTQASVRSFSELRAPTASVLPTNELSGQNEKDVCQSSGGILPRSKVLWQLRHLESARLQTSARCITGTRESLHGVLAGSLAKPVKLSCSCHHLMETRLTSQPLLVLGSPRRDLLRRPATRRRCLAAHDRIQGSLSLFVRL
jgi:hypothetical protein